MPVDPASVDPAKITAPALHVIPRVALIDVPRDIRLTGFAPCVSVQITARYTAADTARWTSSARFVTDASGCLDLDIAAPLAGSYEGADRGGLIWSLALESHHALAKGDEGTATRVIQLSAVDAEGHQAESTIEQTFIGAGVTREPLSRDGVVGTVFRPAGDGPRPMVVILNGSGGGINEARAALYAAHGYIGVALGYFNAPGLPAHISGTPLEYFTKALHFLREEYRPAKDFVALQGHSRGAELSLLLASLYPDAVNTVVAYVPSNVMHGTLRAGKPGQDPRDPAWIHKGVPLPTVWDDNRTADWSAFNSQQSPVTQAPSFVSALRDEAAVERAAIVVEQIKGPVLLISGTDDGFWPSTAMADAVLARRAGGPLITEHLRYQGAGHAIQYPGVPTTRIAKPHAVARVELSGGGTAAANALANADSWPRMLAFLEMAFAEHSRV